MALLVKQSANIFRSMLDFQVGLAILFKNQCAHILGVEEIAGNSLKLFGRNGIDMSEERVEIAFMAMMEIASSEVEGKLLPIVTGNG